MALTYALKKTAKLASRKGPLWKGPFDPGPQGGIGYSFLCRFLVCRDRFRVHAIEGLGTADRFNHLLEFGSMWHACEEATHAKKPWQEALQKYTNSLVAKYRMQQEEVVKWQWYVNSEFPVYLDYWRKHPDTKSRVPISQEQVFNVEYPLPSGHKVWLKGKWDGINQLSDGIYLWENKTKGDIDEQQLKRQLSSGFDLQTMLYLVALMYESTGGGEMQAQPVLGLDYNVIKRPRQYQGKKETAEQFFERLHGIIRKSPSEFFMRWKVQISPGDIAKFRRLCLDPILENLCWWWEAEAGVEHRLKNPPHHWRHPFGVWNALDEGRGTDLDEYLLTGNRSDLRLLDDLYPELKVAA